MLNRLFELAIYSGMSPHDFWYGDPEWLGAYVKTKEEQQREEMNKINYSCWIQGIYMTSAIGACLSKNTKYPSEPLDIGLDSEKQKEIKKRKKTEDAYKRLLLWSHSVKGK